MPDSACFAAAMLLVVIHNAQEHADPDKSTV